MMLTPAQAVYLRIMKAPDLPPNPPTFHDSDDPTKCQACLEQGGVNG